MMEETQDLRRGYTKTALRIFHGFVELLVRYLFQLIYGTKGDKMPPIKDLILLESATSIAYKIRTQKISSVKVLQSYIERINEINPLLNCVIANRFEDALKEAKAADDLIRSGRISEGELEKSKPFLGVPFTTKDSIAVKDMIQTAGLYRRRDYIAAQDADVIALLRNAGAIPIALTNVSELCSWWESANTVFGHTSNPYDTNRTVGGSSGGEGCIQAAGGSAFGIGSDIGGSVRMPAFFNGIFGHKPSKNTVSLKGQYPDTVSNVEHGMCVIGPMCRRAEDLLPLFKLIVNQDIAPTLDLDKKVDIKNIKFYYQKSDMGVNLVSPIHPDIEQLFKRVVMHLYKAHKLKAQKLKMQRFEQGVSMFFVDITPPKDAPKFENQLANLDGKINVWLELLKWCVRSSQHTLVSLITAIADKLGPPEGSERHTYIIQERSALTAELKDLLGDCGVLLFPTHPTPAPYHNEPLFKPFNFIYTGIINSLGFPATHIPMGLNSDGLPIGIQVVANHNNDRLCFAVAEELEKAFGGWVPPKIEV